MLESIDKSESREVFPEDIPKQEAAAATEQVDENLRLQERVVVAEKDFRQNLPMFKKKTSIFRLKKLAKKQEKKQKLQELIDTVLLSVNSSSISKLFRSSSNNASLNNQVKSFFSNS